MKPIILALLLLFSGMTGPVYAQLHQVPARNLARLAAFDGG